MRKSRRWLGLTTQWYLQVMHNLGKAILGLDRLGRVALGEGKAILGLDSLDLGLDWQEEGFLM